MASLQALYSKSEKVKGYHGTAHKNVDIILTENFIEATKDEWCGSGCYFFVDGIAANPPHELAKMWASDKAWNKFIKENDYTEYAVLEIEIKVKESKLLDLTVAGGRKQFNEFRNQYLSILEKNGTKVYGKVLDGDIIDIMKEAIGYEFVKADVYIKFGTQRIKDIRSNMPNVTIFAVTNPKKNIQRNLITVFSKGVIS